MHYDALTSAAVAAEWRERLVGGRIDKIFQPDAWSIALLVRSHNQNWQVFQSFNPRFARAHLVTERKLGSGFDQPSAFIMLLRKHLEGARIVAVRQPPLERILRLEAAYGDGSRHTLILELLGRQSNAILVDEQDTVLGALRPVTAAMSRSRQILPHQPYMAPALVTGAANQAGGARLDPRHLDVADLARVLTDLPAAPVAEALPRLLVISPTAAAEAVYRAAGDAGAREVDPARLAESLCALFRPLVEPEASWAPSLAQRGSMAVAFAPYPLHHLEATATVQAMDSIGLAVERYFSPREGMDRLAGQRSRLTALVKPVVERSARRLTAIESELRSAESDLALREQGDLLLTYQPAIAPGQREVELQDFATGQPRRIAIDAALTAVENAQRLFRRYQRAKRAREALAPQRQELEAALAFARQVQHDITLAETASDLSRVEEEVRELSAGANRSPGGRLRAAGRKLANRERVAAASASEPSLVSIGGFAVLYGRTSHINDALTFRLADRHDLWLHAKGVPGAHVVIRTGGRVVPEEVLLRAAGLAAYLSPLRQEARAAVDYTAISQVRRQPGGKPGLVFYTGERTVQAPPLSPEEAAREAVLV